LLVKDLSKGLAVGMLSAIWTGVKTIFEAASMVVLFAVSQFAFDPSSVARPAPDNGVSVASTASATQADSNNHGGLVKPLSL
jgi:hypothetical protein